MAIYERHIGFVAAVVGAALWYLALGLPEIPTHGDVGPAFFPKTIAVMLFVCAAFFLLQGIRRRNVGNSGGPWDLAAMVKILSLLAVTVVYVAAMEPLGFVISTSVYLVAGGYVFGDRRWPMLCLASMLSTALLYAAFKVWLKVPLPPWDNFMSTLFG
jgi:putative tricarboxylic transport membrane protein